MTVTYIKDTRGTFLRPEICAGPRDGYKRKGAAIFPDGKLRCVLAKRPDTFYSVPAVARIKGKRVKGFLTCEGDVWHFNPERLT